MFVRFWPVVAGFLIIATPAGAWDGTDSDTGAVVEIGKGNLVRSGQEIEVYDYSDGTYRNVTVESIEGNGSNVEVEVYDHETGETRTLEMDAE